MRGEGQEILKSEQNNTKHSQTEVKGLVQVRGEIGQ